METLNELTKELQFGGAIVCSSQCHPIELADARVDCRMVVTDDGTGYVLRRQEWLDHVKSQDAKIEQLEAITVALDELRSGEGDLVKIFYTNPEPEEPNDQQTILVNADWTDWFDEQFTGETLTEALKEAVKAKASAQAAKTETTNTES